MMQSGFDAVISEKLGRDATCRGAAAVSRPCLKGLEPSYDREALSRGRARRRIPSGLNLLDFSVVSEDRSAHPDSHGVVEITRYIAAMGTGSGAFRRQPHCPERRARQARPLS